MALPAQSGELSASQLERITRNREEALARRRAAMQREQGGGATWQQAHQGASSQLSTGSQGTPSHSGWVRVKREEREDAQKRHLEEPIPLGRDKAASMKRTLDYASATTSDAAADGAAPQHPAREADGATAGPTVPRAKMMLSRQQMKVLKAIAMGKSVFVTGSAGTGKSFLLEFAIRQLRAMHGSESVHITASTGLAACAIGGSTLHSFAGIGLGQDKPEILLGRIMSKRELRTRWQQARALVIDEISMIDAPLLDKLNYIARKARKREQAFGGIQLLVTGDFFQLPPVSKNDEKAFAFEAKCWASCFDAQVQLTRVFRQSDDVFVGILNQIRKGTLSKEAAALLTQRLHAPISGCSQDGIIATRVYPYKVDVSAENGHRLCALPLPEHTYTASDEAKTEYEIRQLENMRAEKHLRLRLGAQVMLLKNLDTSRSLVNGSRGVVVRFVPTSETDTAEFRPYASTVGACGAWPVVRFADGFQRLMGPEVWSVEKDGKVLARRAQVPLALAWALSVHKCQGMTLDRVETNLSRAFDCGMVYVALSRVRSLQGLHLTGFDPRKITVHGKVIDFYAGLERCSSALDDQLEDALEAKPKAPKDEENEDEDEDEDEDDVGPLKGELSK